MQKVVSWLKDSKYIAPLSPACRMCATGSKIVLLITGLCPAKCYYCPLSEKKLGKDRIFADEWELDNKEDTEKLILEAKYINAKGAGITGGDPLIVWERTKKYISFLKDNFGSKFHIHLYTSGKKNGFSINDLVSAGLDEIRFHPLPEYWNKMNKNPLINTIKIALKTDVDVAIEIPVIPNCEKEIISLIKWADKLGLKWINLNELEFSETNSMNLTKKGFNIKDDISSAVKGSEETAYNILDLISKEDCDIGVHYCSSSFKDGIQLKNRIKTRAKNIVKNFETITDEGTILKGVIYSEKITLENILKILKEDFNVQEKFLFKNLKKNRVEIAVWILENIAKSLEKLGLKCFLIEEYPTADALEVERIPLPV